MFVGRKKELRALNEKFNSNKKEFGVIYGRRRIGKSSLINEFMKDKIGIFFQAKKDSLYGNLKSFSYELDKFMNLPSNFVFESFEEALDSFSKFTNGKRMIIAIDEYPYIVSQDSSFPSILQEFFDRASDNIFLILSGSDVSMLKEELLNHNSPLYKRRTFEMYLKKLEYDESLEYLKNISNEDKVKFLSLTSTYPYYLSAMDFSISFEENIRKLLFNEYGAFFTLPDQLLSSSTNIQDVYNSILHAVSKRKRSNKEISEFIHEEEAKVSKYISLLVEQELLQRNETYMGNKKTIYYSISDPMLRFWYYFIYENSERIKLNGDIVLENLKDEINKFISFGFEDVCRLYMDFLNKDGRLGNVFNPFKTYKVEKSVLNRSVELDGLSDDGTTLIVMECKFRNIKFNYNMFLHLKESASVFPSKLERKYYLFSKLGFDKDMDALSEEVKKISLDDLFYLK